MANSPLQGAEGPVRLTISSDGAALADSISVVSIEITKALNRIPQAVLTFSDGDMPNKDFPLSNQSQLAPGAKLVVKLGYEDDEQQGLVVRRARDRIQGQACGAQRRRKLQRIGGGRMRRARSSSGTSATAPARSRST